MSFVRRLWEPVARREIAKLRNKSVLEVGAGTHSFSEFFDESCDVVTTDKAEADVRKLPFDDKSFDVVLCFNVLEHVFEWEQAVREMFRVLRNGGLLFCKTPFLYPLHDEPNDFWRFSPHTLFKVFKPFGSMELFHTIGFWRFSPGHFFIVKKQRRFK